LRAGLAARGKVWALLGLARLHLSAPPAGADPAAKHAQLRGHTLSVLTWHVDPELAARQQYARLPGGPDEAAAIAALQARQAELLGHAERLDGRSPPRPAPPQYLALQEDASRFLEGLSGVGRMVAMVGGVARREPAALQQAAVWEGNAAAWSARLSLQYPLYRDVVQPVQLAVHELRYGLALGCGAAALGGTGAGVAEAAAQLMTFPTLAAAGAGQRGESDGMQQAVAAAAAAAAADRGAADGAAADAASPAADAAAAAALVARLKLLRVALHEASHQAAAASTAAAKSAAADRLHRIFLAFLAAWEEVKAEEARVAAEEAELYKSKLRTIEVLSEEQEDEVDYRQVFPDRSAPFADLQQEEELGDGLGPDAPPPPADLPAAASAAAAAAPSAREFVLGEVLQDLVAAHGAAFGAAAAAAVPSTPGDAGGAAAFERSYALGVDLLRQAGLCLPAAVDDAALTGHLYAVGCLARRLGRPPAASAEEADMQAAHVEEAVLVQAPLQAARARVCQLLGEWPDHPVLLQLSGIADRVLGMPAASPLKALLTGLELLLARAQVWEETAAKHVTLGAELRAVAALATRWRRLELGSWRGLLQRTAARFAARAHHGWFHLYRIVHAGDGAPGAVAAGVEAFLQAAPLGEYAARLELVALFRRQLAAPGAAGTAPEEGARRAALASILHNLGAYYGQFAAAVEATVAAGLAPLHKELKDFVALAKWEDRGYYAMKASTEKAQRQLHRLCRRATTELREPAATVLAATAKKMGLNDLAAPAVDAPEGAPPAAASRSKKGKAAEAQAAAAAAPAALFEAPLALGALGAVAGQAVAAAAGAEELAPGSAGKYGSKLPQLTRRFAQVVGASLAGQADAGACHAHVDGLAAEAAARALHLRQDGAKGAKARKKKALVDMFRALGAAGISKRITAVPAASRGANAWVAQVRPPSQQKTGDHVLCTPIACGVDCKLTRFVHFLFVAGGPRPGPAAAAQRGRRGGGAAARRRRAGLAQGGRLLLRQHRAAAAAHRGAQTVLLLCRALETTTIAIRVGRSPLPLPSPTPLPAGRQAGDPRPVRRRGGGGLPPQRAPPLPVPAGPRRAGRHRALLRPPGQAAQRAARQPGRRPAPPRRPRAAVPGAAGGARGAGGPHRPDLGAAVGHRGRGDRGAAPARADRGGGHAGGRAGAAPRDLRPAGRRRRRFGGPPHRGPAVHDGDGGRRRRRQRHAGGGARGARQLAARRRPRLAAASRRLPPCSLRARRRPTGGGGGAAWGGRRRGAPRGGQRGGHGGHRAGVGAGSAARGGAVARRCRASRRGGADDDDDGSEVLPEVMRAAEQRLGLPRVEQLLTQCLSAFAGLAALADCQDGAATAAAAAALRAFAPMLGLLRCGLWQHGARYLGLHRAAAKLSYVTSALFAGLVEEGFCVADAEGAQPCNITPCPRCSLFRPAVSRMLPFSHPRALLPAPRSSRLRRGRAPGRRGQDHRGHWPGRGRHARRQGHHRPAGGPGPAAWRPAEGAGGGEEGGGGAGRPGGPGRQGRRDGRRLRGRAGGRARGPAGRRGCAPFFPSACSSGMLSMCARRLD
jgi:hypothetical protein